MPFSPLLFAAALPLAAADPTKLADLPKPQELSAHEDHKKMMELLKIKELRPGANPNEANAPNAVNRDEAKGTPYPKLPDPLMFDDGKPVKTADDWKKRRAEIVEHFDREVYGRVPKEMPKVTWKVADTTQEKVGDIGVTKKKLVGTVNNSAYPHVKVEIQLTLVTPTDAPGPVPVMMEFGFNFGGGFTPPAPPKDAPKPWTQQLIEKGWGYAVLVPTSVQADTGGSDPKRGDATFDRLVKSYGGSGDTLDYEKIPDDVREQTDAAAKRFGGPPLPKTGTITRDDYRAEFNKRTGGYQGLTTGIIGLCNKGQPRQPEDWGALRAWAWGAGRALDYFETDKAVDAKQVGIEGLSRYGKAALVTMAYDERFVIGFIGSSGQGGAKIMRRDFGEKVENVAGSGEYHWMCGNYLKYAGPKTPDDLPVDAHELVALCAPRPVFVSVGAEKLDGNGWIDAKGNFLSAVGAGPVYKLLGKKDLGTADFPKQETPLTDGEVAFRQHEGGHTTGPNWPTFLTWADRYIKAPAGKGR